MRRLLLLAATAATLASASATLAQGPGGADNPPGYPPASGCALLSHGQGDTHYGNILPFGDPPPTPVPTHDPHCPGG